MSGPTPSSEIIHLVGSFTDTLDALPPSLTRSLSDLKELDAVLSGSSPRSSPSHAVLIRSDTGSLSSITAKLESLLEMMHSPSEHTPFDRLKLLREVTEDARVFRLGGEDKIRVATGTCETVRLSYPPRSHLTHTLSQIATNTSHLSTLSTLLLTFLPSHLLPMLPPPSAPHGYPASITPSSALARRQIFDYPVANHAGSGSTTRMQGALGLVREHWDVTRGRERPNQLGKRKSHLSIGSGPAGLGEREMLIQQQQHAAMLAQQQQLAIPKEQDLPRHPNQYPLNPKKKPSTLPHQLGPSPQHPSSLPHPQPSALYAIPPHSSSLINNSLDKEKRRVEQAQGAATSHPLGRNPSGNGAYPGMASAAEYELATNGGGQGMGAGVVGRTQKRKTGTMQEENGGTKRRKKLDISPEPLSRSLPLDLTSSSAPLPLPFSNSTVNASQKVARRTNAAAKMDEELSPDLSAPLLLLEDEEGLGEGEDDADGQTYCYCHRVSFGEMIGCDGNECDREWVRFHTTPTHSLYELTWCDSFISLVWVCRRYRKDVGSARNVEYVVRLLVSFHY